MSGNTGLKTKLQSYAARDKDSRGRVFAEPEPQHRGQFQRDRDRIIHSAAFRRLEYKTQVFVNHEGDMFRTRLTHSIEVAQIARTIARTMGLNEDLTEAIAMAHDLGHTPFGHAGQSVLNTCMCDYGGFEHNLQSLRVVEILEQRYASFRGLNLTYETREGILKHCSRKNAEKAGDLGKRFLEGGQPSLEAQIANISDEIAYNNHDIDDGLRSGLLSLEQLREVPLVEEHYNLVREAYAKDNEKFIRYEMIRSLINHQVVDLLEASDAAITQANPESIKDVRTLEHPLICFSENMSAQIKLLKKFLHRNLYRHYRVSRMNAKANRILSSLFEVFMQDSSLLPMDAREHVKYLKETEEDTEGQEKAVADFVAGTTSSRYAILATDSDFQARAIADYIAGMTDRYAITEYRRIFDPEELT